VREAASRAPTRHVRLRESISEPSEERLPRAAGMVPSSMLCVRSRYARLLIPPQLGGMVPVRRHELSDSSLSSVRPPNDAGSVPFSSLP